MVVRFRNRRASRPAIPLIGALAVALVAACAPADEAPTPADEAPGPADLTDFATEARAGRWT